MTVVDVFNAALATCGHDRQVVGDHAEEDSSVEAVRCRTFYDGARRMVFAFHDWQWLCQERTLTQVDPIAPEAPNPGPMYLVEKPDHLLRVLSVKGEDGTPLAYSVLQDGIHVDRETVVVRYVEDLLDPDAWPPLIQDAVVAELAARVCIPLTGNFELSNKIRQQSALLMRQAAGQYSPDQDAEGDGRSRPEEDRGRR